MIIPKEMVIKIAEHLDCYSLIQLAKVSRIFRYTLLPIMHRFSVFSISHYNKNNVIIVPGGSVYCSFTQNDMHFHWNKIELPSHIVAKKAKLALNSCYLMCSNLQSGEFELWKFPICMYYMEEKIPAIKVEIEVGIIFIELFVYNYAVFALTDKGYLYGWSTYNTPKHYEFLGVAPNCQLDKPNSVLITNKLWCEHIHLGLGKPIFTNAEAFNLYIAHKINLAAFYLILRQNSVNEELKPQLHVEKSKCGIYTNNTNNELVAMMVFSQYYRDNLQRTVIYPVKMPTPVVIQKVYFQSLSFYAVSEENHCFAWGDNTYNCLGVSNEQNIIQEPHPILGLEGQILSIIKTGNDEVNELNNIGKFTLFLTSYGVFYSGRRIPRINPDTAIAMLKDDAVIDNKRDESKWHYYPLKFLKHPEILCRIPSEARLSHYITYQDTIKISVVGILNGRKKPFLFCSQIALNAVDMRWYGLPRSQFYAVAFPEDDSLKDWVMDNMLWLVTVKGYIYKWDMGWGNELARQPTNGHIEKIAITENILITLGRDAQRLPTFFSMPLKRIKGDHPYIKLELKENKFPLLYSVDNIHHNYLHQVLVSAAKELLIRWSEVFKFKSKMNFVKLLYPLAMLANGHIAMRHSLDFMKMYTLVKQKEGKFLAVFRILRALYLSHIALLVQEGTIKAEDVIYPFEDSPRESSILALPYTSKRQ